MVQSDTFDLGEQAWGAYAVAAAPAIRRPGSRPKTSLLRHRLGLVRRASTTSLFGHLRWTVVRTATLECTAATVPRGEGEACLRAGIRVASNCPKPGQEGFVAVFDAHRLHRACLRRNVYTVERLERLMQATQN